jgi:acyl-CoA thioesterase-1
MKSIMLLLGLLLIVFIAVTLTKIGILYSQVERYKQYWATERDRDAEPGSVSYIALGDSGAQGIGATRPEKSYVGLLANSIGNKTNQPVHITNLSVSGAKVADVSRVQIPQLKGQTITDDTIITLSIGGNDAVHRNPNFATDIDKLFSQLPKQTIVSDVGYFGGGRFNTRESYVQEVNPLLYEAAEKYGLTIAPLYKVTKERNSLFTNAIDIFHPSNRGYQNWYDAFWPEVEKQL